MASAFIRITKQVTSDTTPTIVGYYGRKGVQIPASIAVTVDGLTYAATVNANGTWAVALPNGSADATFDNLTDTWTATAHGFVNDDKIELTTSGTLPTGYSAGVTYHVVGATANTFQLSATQGGAPVNGLDNGTGTHTAANPVLAIGTYDVVAVATYPDTSTVSDTTVDELIIFEELMAYEIGPNTDNAYGESGGTSYGFV